MTIASIGVLAATIVAGALLLRNASYSGVVFGSSTPSAPGGPSSASTLSKVCGELPNLGISRVDLMQRTITSLRADRTALVDASDRSDATKVAKVIQAATRLRAALNTGAVTTTLQSQLSSAVAAVPC